MGTYDKSQKRKLQMKRWREANRDKLNAYFRNWRAANPKKVKAIHRRHYKKNGGEHQRKYYHKDIQKSRARIRANWVKHYERHMFNHIRRRAEELGVAFNLRPDDIIIPKRCPVLGISIIIGGGSKLIAHSPSADRMNPNCGYTRKNTRIISMRANTLKNNATVKELELVIKYMKNSKKHRRGA